VKISMTIFGNHINGEWIAESTTSRNPNPGNLSDLMGESTRGDMEDADVAVARHLKPFLPERRRHSGPVGFTDGKAA